MTPPSSFLLDTFTSTVVPISKVPLETLHAFSVGVSWPHRPEDWNLFRSLGTGYAALDEIDRPVGTAMWFPYGADFATIGMVIISPRLQAQGAGRWLMKHVLADTRGRRLGLNATRAAYGLYLSLGFQVEQLVYQCNGRAQVPEAARAPDGGTLRDFATDDIGAILELDASAFGAGRGALLTRLLSLSRCVVLVREGRVVAFALCRRFGRGHVVGPIVASSDTDAIAVTRPHIADHAGQFLRLDTRRPEGTFREFLTHSGLPTYDTVTTMSLNGTWTQAFEKGGRPTIYGLAAQAIG